MTNHVSELINKLSRDEYTKWLETIYVDTAALTYQKGRYIQALETFKEIYGDCPVHVFSASGRSEVGGNHTDHQRGRVLATSINLDAIAVVSATDEKTVKIKSEGYDMIEVRLDDLEKDIREEGQTIALIKGVLYKLKEAGYRIGGFSAYVTSDVIGGAGMSSSAAFEVLIGTMVSGLYNGMEIDPVTIAQVGQFAENEYFGKPCGLMDQMACSVGGMIYIDFHTQGCPVVKKVPVDFEKYGHSLCIVNTKGSHADLTDEYAAIPAEMKQVAGYFGKDVLDMADKDAFYENIATLRGRYGDRTVLRALHFYEENERVKRQLRALEAGDFDEFKTLVEASGNSSYKYLQNVYSRQDVQSQSLSVALAVSDVVLKDKGVCRVHGGGFAGTIQAFVPNAVVKTYQQAMENLFGPDTCYVLKVRNYGGMKVF